MTRMTHHIRDKLLKDLIERRFKDQAQELMKRRAAFAARVYRSCFSEVDHKRMEALPARWLPTDISFKVQIAHAVVKVYLTGAWGDYGYLGDEMLMAGATKIENAEARLPYGKYSNGSILAVFDADSDIRKEYDQLCNDNTDLIEKIREASTATKKVLASVGSIKKLIEVWPEVEAFATPYLSEGERRAILPMIPREKINNILGLPPSEKEVIE